MRILMFATDSPIAKGYGVSRYTSDLAITLAKLGIEVHLVCMNLAPGTPEHSADGVHIHFMNEKLPFDSFHWVSDAVLCNVQLLQRAIEVAQTTEFDLICAHDWLAALAAKSLKSIYDIPLVVTIHSTQVGKLGQKLTREEYYTAEMESWISREASLVIVTSEFMKREVSTTYRIPENKLCVIPCGVNPDHFATNCNLGDFKQIFAKDGQQMVLFVGQLTEHKGPQVLLEAAKIVVGELPDVIFVFAGNGEQKELAALVERYGLERNVLFTEYLSGKVLAATYRAADCVVVPSLYEPFGLVPLEAMVCETPVIVSDTGGLAECIEHGANGLKVPPNEPNALAQEIARLLKDGGLAKSLREEAHRRCEENLWSNVGQKIKRQYEMVTAKK